MNVEKYFIHICDQNGKIQWELTIKIWTYGNDPKS